MKRHLSAFLLGLVTLVNASAASNTQLRFDVYLDEALVGQHEVLIEGSQGSWQAQTQTKIDVPFLFLTAYRYRHQATELWASDCLEHLDTQTDDDGSLYQIKGKRSANGFLADNGETETLLNGCIRSFAYWNPELLKSPRLLNTQTGEYEWVRLTAMGNNPLRFQGRELGERQLRLTISNDRVIDLWYDNNDQWLGLQSEVRGGRMLRYLIKGKTL